MAQQTFDPNQYVSKVKGRDYLEVKWRIAWGSRLSFHLAGNKRGKCFFYSCHGLGWDGYTHWGGKLFLFFLYVSLTLSFLPCMA